MDGARQEGTPKVHPATREVLPDDPMQLYGFEVRGDPQQMLQLLVEEYARFGEGPEAILELARDPNYQAFHQLWQLFGEEQFERRVREILSRCGVIRVEIREREPVSEQLVQIQPRR